MAQDRPPGRPAEPAEGLDKSEARRRAFAARQSLSPADHQRLSAAVCARAGEIPELATANTVMLFATFRSELDTTPLVDQVLAAGKTLCLPRVLAPRHMNAYRVTDRAADLAPGNWSIPEPREELPEVPPETIDLVFVPGSAFDERGCRCGFGGGFYDSFLPRTRPGTPWIALAFEVQIMPRIACEEHDLPVTAIVTERRVIRPG